MQKELGSRQHIAALSKRSPIHCCTLLLHVLGTVGTFKGEAPLTSYNKQNGLVVRALLTQLLTRVYTYLSIQGTGSY